MCTLWAERTVKHNTLSLRVHGNPAGDLTTPLTFAPAGLMCRSSCVSHYKKVVWCAVLLERMLELRPTDFNLTVFSDLCLTGVGSGESGAKTTWI